jgi:sugar lactone lactonase YvrE
LTDIVRRRLHAFDWATEAVMTIATEETCTAWIPRAAGGFAIASRSGLRLASGDDAGALAVAVEADQPSNRSNDAKCDPGGRLWLGTMADDNEARAGELYRILSNLDCTLILPGVTISNGLGWSPDGTRMYYIDSPTKRIGVRDYDLVEGQPRNRRPLVDTSGFVGLPDGLAVDTDGCLWVAFYDGGAVHRFTPDGQHAGTVVVPALRPTSCAFVSRRLDQLAITTAAALDGSGGDLYVCDVGVAGVTVAPFKG